MPGGNDDGVSLMTADDGARGAGGILEALSMTSVALESATVENEEAANRLEGPLQAEGFVEGLFDELNAVDPIEHIPFDADTRDALRRIVDALRAVRVAAIALGQPGASAPRAFEQAAAGTSELEAAVSDFLPSFRSFLASAGSEEIQRRFYPVIDRYEEQIEARQLVAEVRETREEAKRVLSDTRRAAGATGESSLARHFGEYASRERRDANLLRGLCVLTLLSIAGVATLLVSSKEASTLNTAHELAKLAITIPLAVLAAYLGREATRHRKVARRARELEIQLQTVDAFAHPLPESLRDRLRSELGRQVFASPPPAEIFDDRDSGPSVVTDAGELIEKIADLLKALAVNRPG